MEPTLAEIRMFGGNFAPRGWALCQGQLLSIAQNQALFSLLGTTYGGDGRTTFALPDMRGRFNLGPGHGPGLSDVPQGQRSGTQVNTMTTLTMPTHNHGKIAFTGSPNMVVGENVDGGDDPSDLWPGIPSPATNTFNSTPSTGEFYGAVENAVTVTVLNQGGQQYINNMQPYLTVNFIIATAGLFPSRS